MNRLPLSGPVEVYRLGRDGVYHFVGAVLLIFLIVQIFLALGPAQSEQVLQDLGSVTGARLFQAAILGVGALPLASWLWWVRRYVRRVAWDGSTGEVELEVFRHFGRKIIRLRPGDLAEPAFHRGKLDLPRKPSVDAPYIKVRVGGSKSLIVDLRGDVIDSEALMTILAGNDPTPSPRPAPPASREASAGTLPRSPRRSPGDRSSS